MDKIKDMTLAIHKSHGYIDTHYSRRGSNRLIFPDQNLGNISISREMRYEIVWVSYFYKGKNGVIDLWCHFRTIVAQKVPTKTCIKDNTEYDQYCLERKIASQLCCQVPSENSVDLPSSQGNNLYISFEM